jgi:hypothetical protein
LKLVSALAAADFTTLATSSAASRDMKSSTVSASATGIPSTTLATSRALRAGTLTHLAVA